MTSSGRTAHDWTVEYDRDVWVAVPVDFANAKKEREWAVEVADDYVGRGLVDPGGRDQLADFAVQLVRVAEDCRSQGELYAYFPDPETPFLAMFLSVEESGGESPDVLLNEIGATQLEASIDPPVVSSYEAKFLGEGVRCTRFGAAADGQIYGTVIYAFRAADTNIVATTQSYNIEALLGIQPALEQFLDGIAPVTV